MLQKTIFVLSYMLKNHTAEKPFEKDKLVTREARCLNLQTRAQKSQKVITIKKIVHMEQTNGSFEVFTFLIKEY